MRVSYWDKEEVRMPPHLLFPLLLECQSVTRLPVFDPYSSTMCAPFVGGGEIYSSTGFGEWTAPLHCHAPNEDAVLANSFQLY